MNDIIFRVIVPDNKILFKTLMLKGERGLQGTSIVSIEKTQTIGLTDYYTITLNDGTTYEFTVQNGTNSYFDDELSLASENAVQNKIITAAINSINAALASIQQYDNALSSSSENAVQNKVVKSAIDSINSAIALLGQYDSALSASSENAVQNKVVKAALDLKANLTALNNYYNKTEIDAAFNNLGASGVSYNNASSGLSATDTQSAIDEIDNALSGKQPLIKHLQKKGTTDNTGDLLVPELPLANYQILSAYKNRSVSGENAVGYCILGGNNQTAPYIHLINSNNANLTSTAVTIEIDSIDI